MAFQQLPYAIRPGPNWDALNSAIGGGFDAVAQRQQQEQQLKQALAIFAYQQQVQEQQKQNLMATQLQNSIALEKRKNQMSLENSQNLFNQDYANNQKLGMIGGGQQQQPQAPMNLFPQGTPQPAMSMANGGLGTAQGQPIDLGAALMRMQQGQQGAAPAPGQSGQSMFLGYSKGGKFSTVKNPDYKNTQASAITSLDISQLKQAKTPEERQALLDQLPPEVAKNVQLVGEYNSEANKVYGLRNNSGDRAKFDALVGMAYPGFDMKKYPQRQAYMNDLAKGKLNQQVIALNTVKKHLDTFDQSIDALNNGNFTPKNAIINAAKELSGDPSITDFKLAQRVVYSEMERLLTGVGVTQQGLEHLNAIISGKAGYRQMKDQVALLKTIINGRMQPLRMQFKNVMGKDESGEIVFPNSSTYSSGAAESGQGAGSASDSQNRVGKYTFQ